MVRIQDIAAAIERIAPLRFQDDFDNSGLQVGFPSSETGKVLVCLDVTEDVVKEAADKGCGLIVSHHPLLFRALRQVSDSTYQQRCAVEAIRRGIGIYSAHTSLDNAPGGVNHRIASLIGLESLQWLSPKPDGESGSGLVGNLREPLKDDGFLSMLKDRFGVSCLMHSQTSGRTVRRVALCGGAGAFLLPDAIREGADCFVCGEFHYHDYFENKGVLLAYPSLEVIRTSIDTNPIRYSK